MRKRKQLPLETSPNDLQGKYQELYTTIQSGALLTDRHIDAANQLLSDKFPNIQGLSTPLLGQKLQFPMYNCFAAAAGFPYVQIVHCPVIGHWLTIQVDFDEEVRIFDSLFSNKVSFEVKKQIASILQSKHAEINFKFEKTQQQKNAVDCGIFAIAFATDLCHGNDPVGCAYSDGHQLRLHFLRCLQEGCINPFPSKPVPKQKPSLQRMKIYCKCRLPYVLEHKKKKDVNKAVDDIKMIYCDICQNWFHTTCMDRQAMQSISEKPDVEWVCNDCAAAFDLISDD